MPDPDPSGAEAARDTRSAPSHRTEGRSPRRRGRSASHRNANTSRDSEGKSVPVYAAVDLGTNNCRLLIAKPNPKGKRGLRIIDSYSEIVKLGDGLGRTGRLSERSMDASIEALKVCAEKIHRKNTTAWRCVATQACRQAENGQDFIKRVREDVGLRMEIISPRVEARLSVMGCVNLVDTKKKVALVVDIGGGSTELSWVDIGRLKRNRAGKTKPPINAWASLPVGVATLSEMFPEHDDRDKWYNDMKAQVRKCIVEQSCESHFSQVFRAGQGHIIGTSGTITSLAGVHLKLPYYQRKKVDGLWMPTESAVEIARDLASRDIVSRASVPSIGEDRASLLVAGCAIMDVLCEMWPSERIRVADRGLREGILMGLIHRPRGSGRGRRR